MHIHRPKPIHGWRQFFGEVGVIVLGVLIALGAEQAVEAIHWHREASEFEDGIRYELADTLAAFKYRADQSACVDRRLAELTQYQMASQKHHFITILAAVGQPSIYNTRMGVWMSRSPEVMNELPTQKRLAYASQYDNAQRISEQQVAEQNIWLSINAYVGFSSLTADQQMKLNELIYQAKHFAAAIPSNYAIIAGQAKDLGITPAFGARRNIIEQPDQTICRPLMRPAD